MNKNDIKFAIGKIIPDKELEAKMAQNILKKKPGNYIFKALVPAVAGLVLIVSLGFLGLSLLEAPGTSPDNGQLKNGVLIPSLKLPEKTGIDMDMVGLVVYQGRIYTQAGTRLSPEAAESLPGEKLGTTKGNIDEWSQQDDYAVELASSIGKQDIYSVKGYDKSFRIMGFDKTNGIVNAEFYECLNGITVKTGADVFKKLNMTNNIKSARFEGFESWNNTRQEYNELTQLDEINSFTEELNNTIPYQIESLSYLWEDNKETDQKFIYLSLNDGSEVQLRLFEEGYVYYSGAPVLFKMEKQSFGQLWKVLE